MLLFDVSKIPFGMERPMKVSSTVRSDMHFARSISILLKDSEKKENRFPS